MLENLDRLKVFHQIFSKGSVLGAAGSLNVSQSAVSQSLAKLEAEIQCQLFTRMHKRLVPTRAGHHLFSVIQPFMEGLEHCLDTLTAARDTPSGRLCLGAPVEFGKAYLPAILARFRKQYPGVTFLLELGDAARLLPMVENGDMDFAFVDAFLTQNPFSVNLDRFHFDPVVTEEVILACSSDYYETRIKPNPGFDGLRSQDFITSREEGQAVQNWFSHHFNRSNVSFNIVLTVNSLQAAISAICNHAGMGVVASHLARDEMAAGQIVPITTRKPAIVNQIVLTQLLDKRPTLTEKTFLSFFLSQIRSLGLNTDSGSLDAAAPLRPQPGKEIS